MLSALCLVAGVACGLYRQLAARGAETQSYAANDWPVRTISAWRHFNNALLDWPWNLVVGASLLGLIVILRFKRSAWGPAFVLGALLGAVMVRLAQTF